MGGVSTAWGREKAKPAAQKSNLLDNPKDKMSMAFGDINDDQALKFARQALAEEPNSGAAEAVIQDLARRKRLGTFGKVPSEIPPYALETWVENKDVHRLIGLLDDVRAYQEGGPGGVPLDKDWRVDALIRIGEPAIPALIDTIEKDQRLTRSVHCWRFGVGCAIMDAREAALTAAMSILKVQAFEPVATGDSFSARGHEAEKSVATLLREYWQKYGKFPFDERMMKIVTDPKISGERLREAVVNLASLGEEVRLGTTVWTNKVVSQKEHRENPAIAKFSNPTAAEAILAALKRDLAANDASKTDQEMREYERQRIEADYASALAVLGDKRVAPAVLDLARNATNRQLRFDYAWAANDLGAPAEFQKICQEVADGAWKFDANGQDDFTARMLSVLDESQLPEAKAALTALANPKHPNSTEIVLYWCDNNRQFIYQPYVLRILQAGLENLTPTGGKYAFDESGMSYRAADGSTSAGGAPPDVLSDPNNRLNEAPERICDRAADALAYKIWTLPQTHPLLKDNATRLESLKSQMARYRFREAKGEEWNIEQRESGNGCTMQPDIPPLDRPATAEDVVAGKAVFSLDEKARLAPLVLPASAIFHADAKKKNPRTAIIVQAEVQSDGTTKYGALIHGGIVVLTDADLQGVKSIQHSER